MPSGRCAGCGSTGSVRKVSTHILTCHEYLALFRQSPQRCLDPQAEHERYKTEDDTSEARAARRDQRLKSRFVKLDGQQRFAARRWQQLKDILED